MKPIHLHAVLPGNTPFPGSVTSQILEGTEWNNPFFSKYFNNAAEGGLLNVKFFNLEKLVALTLLIAILPVLICVALLVRLSGRGPVFYKQVRTGHKGKSFSVFKFRTMILDAESSTGATLSWSGDPRITPIGKFLRKSHLDELPQLFNVIRGEMSFIGPRPERPVFTDVYNEDIQHYSFRELVRPGITGLAQICCPYDATAVQKLRFDLLYVYNRRCAVLNLMIAYYTTKKMIFLRNQTVSVKSDS